MLTLGLSVVLSELILTNGALTGGFFGTTIASPSLFGLNIDGYDHPARYGLFVLGCLTVSAVAVANLRRGASGRRMIAVRGNERAAASLGINVYTTKVFAFAIAGGDCQDEESWPCLPSQAVGLASKPAQARQEHSHCRAAG